MNLIAWKVGERHRHMNLSMEEINGIFSSQQLADLRARRVVTLDDEYVMVLDR